MSASRSWRRLRKFGVRGGVVTAVVVVAGWAGDAARSARPEAGPEQSQLAVGGEIFHREWLKNDPRSAGGDGLGPVFNESSCVACHNLGGSGGGGSIEKNVTLLTASMAIPAIFNGPAPSLPQGVSGIGIDVPASSPEMVRQVRESLANIHPDFAKSNSIVLHRFGHNRGPHELWLGQARSGGQVAQLPANLIPDPFVDADVAVQVQAAETPVFQSTGTVVLGDQVIGQPDTVQQTFVTPIQSLEGITVLQAGVDASQFPVISRVMARITELKANVHPIDQSATNTGSAVLQTSQRNTTALFGIGAIDEIPDEAIEAAFAAQQGHPDVSGRIHRLPDGRIGRFGWKAQKATLYDFTMAACGVELGLEVPDHAQAPVPYHVNYKAPGLDLDQDDCDALVAYLRNLPPPEQNIPDNDDARKRIERGEELFNNSGCAACHVKQMGDVDGLFSDMLLHDLGPELGGSGSYGIQPTPIPEGAEQLGDGSGQQAEGSQQSVAASAGPSPTEWRTPPLWGIRDSAPYLHDGRAKSVETAIAFHGGEAAPSRLRFFSMSDEDQQEVLAFLKTLTAPVSD